MSCHFFDATKIPVRLKCVSHPADAQSNPIICREIVWRPILFMGSGKLRPMCFEGLGVFLQIPWAKF
jgi:hypothetical protein